MQSCDYVRYLSFSGIPIYFSPNKVNLATGSSSSPRISFLSKGGQLDTRISRYAVDRCLVRTNLEPILPLFILYADDTTISCSNNGLKILISNTMQTEINKVSEWLNVNKLSLNIKDKY